MSKVAIVGSGFVGRAWAISFARAGREIALWDADASAPAKALDYIEGVLPDLAANDLLAGASAARFARAHAAPSPTSTRRWMARSTSRKTRPRMSRVKREIFARLDAARGARRRARELDLGDPAFRLHRRSSQAARAAWSSIPSIRPI